MSCCIRYFRIVRDRDLDSKVRDGVDTLLLKLYTELNQTDELKLLVSSPNSCVLVCIILNKFEFRVLIKLLHSCGRYPSKYSQVISNILVILQLCPLFSGSQFHPIGYLLLPPYV